MTADQIRSEISSESQRVYHVYGAEYARGWAAALEWVARKEEGEQ